MRLRRSRTKSRSVRASTGQRIKLFGGYDQEPQWLGDRDAIFGTIEAWMPGQNENPACLVHLDSPLTAQGGVRGRRRIVTGEWVVLETRYVGQQWERTGTVHVELCGSRPPALPWVEREAGTWVESHATYELV